MRLWSPHPRPVRALHVRAALCFVGLVVGFVGLVVVPACGGPNFSSADLANGGGNELMAGSAGQSAGAPGGGTAAPGGTAGGALPRGGGVPAGGEPAGAGRAGAGPGVSCAHQLCGTPCSGSCVGSASCPAHQCDGLGQCVPAPVSCTACSAKTDCALTNACNACWDGSCAPVSVECIQGQCVTSLGTCPPQEVPCYGARCGDECRVPCLSGSTCPEQVGYCNDSGICRSAHPECAPVCSVGTDCVPVTAAACNTCPDGSELCASVICYQERCVQTNPRCPCDAMQAEGIHDGSAPCATSLGWKWTGASCQEVIGCTCSGADCFSLFATQEICRSRQSGCL